MSVCLIIIYNHNYEANIEKLERLYHNKFDNIFHLVPFYTGKRENVIKVYGSAYQFNEYLIQGAGKFVNEKYSHYVFVADDMIINPEFNQDNILEKLKLDEDSGFINTFKAINYDSILSWDWSMATLRPMFFNKSGCEYKNFIPSIEEAQKCFEKYGLPSKNITRKNLEKIQKHFVKDETDYYRYSFSSCYRKGLGVIARALLATLKNLDFIHLIKVLKNQILLEKSLKLLISIC